MRLSIIIFTIIASLLSCSKNTDSDSLSLEERKALQRADSVSFKVGVTPTEGCLPLYVAEHLGLLDSLHANVHLKKYQALSECRIALQRHMVEAAVIDSSLMQTINQGSTSAAKANSAEGNTPKEDYLTGTTIGTAKYYLLSSKKARARRISQLTDKVIGADSHGVTHDLATMAIDSLIKRKHHLFIIQAEDLRIRTQMVITGNIDAAVLPSPWAEKANKGGAYTMQQYSAATILAHRTAVMRSNDRKKQYTSLLQAISVANDSITKYGKEAYFNLMVK